MLISKLITIAILVCVYGCSFDKRITSEEQIARAAELEELLARGTGYLRINTTDALELAKATFELGRELAPKDPRPLDGLGCLAWRKRNYLLAKEYFESTIAIDSNYARGHAHLGMIYIADGKMENAIEKFKLAVELSPLDAQIRNNYVYLLSKIQVYAQKGIADPKIELLKAVEVAKGIEESMAIQESYHRLRLGITSSCSKMRILE